MRVKEVLKKCMWVMLVILISFLMIQAAQNAPKNIRVEEAPAFRYYIALFREILKRIAAILPVWFLSLLGLARSFLGENWFPFAQKIPIRVTKIILAAAMILLIGVSVAEKVYSEYTTVPFWVRDTAEESFGKWQSAFLWTLFYGMLLYIEQWCIRRNESRQMIRKKQLWVTATIFLAYLIITFLGGVDLWYIPLSHVDCPNDLEDYYLWWFSLYTAVFFLPLWFFSARKIVRLFKNDAQWLALTTIIPRKITVLIALVAAGLMAQQIREYRYWNEWTEFADLPEYGEAAAMGHAFQAMMWGLVLFYMICLFVKQIRAARRAKSEPELVLETGSLKKQAPKQMKPMYLTETVTFGMHPYRSADEDSSVFLVDENRGIRKMIIDSRGKIQNFPGVVKEDFWVKHVAPNYLKQQVRFRSSFEKRENGWIFLWQLQPDGRYWADEGGFGAENDPEVVLYSFLDLNGDFTAPFRIYRLGSMGYSLERFLVYHAGSQKRAMEAIICSEPPEYYPDDIFPQLLGRWTNHAGGSFYQLRDRKETLAYWNEPVLSQDLKDLAQAMLDSEKTLRQMMGRDSSRVQASMTLFWLVTKEPVFKVVLDKFFEGSLDDYTTRTLK